MEHKFKTRSSELPGTMQLLQQQKHTAFNLGTLPEKWLHNSHSHFCLYKLNMSQFLPCGQFRYT